MGIEPASAEACAAEALRAFEEKRWLDFARLMASSDVERFRDQYLSSVGNITPCRTAEQHQQDRPDMPDDVAQYYADQDQRRARAFEAMLLELGFDGIELAIQPAAHVLAFYLRARHFQERALRLRATDPWLRAFATQGRRSFRVIGSLSVGTSGTYVVYRPIWIADESDTRVGPAMLLKMTLGPDGWRVNSNIEHWWKTPINAGRQLETAPGNSDVASEVEARAYAILGAVEEGRWADVVAAIEPRGLQACKDERLDMLRMSAQRFPETLEEYMQQRSELPAFVAEYEFEHERRQVQEWQELVDELLSNTFDDGEREYWEDASRYLAEGLSSEREIERTENKTAAEIAESVFKSADLRTFGTPNHDEPWRPEQHNTQIRVVSTVVGAVYENDSSAHVVYRILWKTPGEEHDQTATRIMTLRQERRGWLMEFDREAFHPEYEGFSIFTVSHDGDDDDT